MPLAGLSLPADLRHDRPPNLPFSTICFSFLIAGSFG